MCTKEAQKGTQTSTLANKKEKNTKIIIERHHNDGMHTHRASPHVIFVIAIIMVVGILMFFLILFPQQIKM